MRILCEYTECGPSYVRTGWGRVFASLGHDFIFWQPAIKPALDIFTEVEPDIFIGTTYGLTRAIAKAIAQRPALKVALYASAWGKLADDIPQEYPITRVTEFEKVAVTELKECTGRPDFIFSHVPEAYLDGVLGGWENAGVKPAGILNAADTFSYLGGVKQERFRSQVAFVGGWWPYKARNLGPYILPLCHPSSFLDVKIFGNQPWPVAQYLGLLDEQDAKHVFASATVCPNVSEPHSTAYGYDIVERPFKVLAAGGFCVSDYVEGMEQVFPGELIPMAKTTEKFHELIRYFVAHPEDRDDFMRLGRQCVLAKHTYFHRVAQMFDLFGMGDDAVRTMAMHQQLIKGQ